MPESFGRYQIKREIGRGGMSTVFHAYDPRFERDVAIKVLPKVFLHDPQFRRRFEREAKTIAHLEHPAIVPVYDFGEQDEQPYIVMRYMSGGSLAERIARGPVPAQDASQVIARLAPALDAANARGIIHRDLKPGNILFDQYGNAFLSDFGVARITQTSSGTLTQGAILGTPAYMSPEQVQGEAVIDGRSDLYSLGVILYEMLTGTTPYQSETPGKLMMMHVLEEAPSIRSICSDLPVKLEAVVLRSMAKKPEDRFATVTEMADTLEAAIQADINPQPSQASSDPTLIARHPERQKTTPIAGPTAVHPKTAAPPMPPPSEIAAAAQAPVGKRRKLPLWAWIAGLVILFGSAGAAGGAFLFLDSSRNSAATRSASALALAAGQTEKARVTARLPAPTRTRTPPSTPLPTRVPPTKAIAPAAVILPSPTAGPTTTPAVPIAGGADQLAFISGNELWTMNIDGSNPVQLTNDQAIKWDPQWTPDGQALTYLSGKCIKMVYTRTGKVDVVNCFSTIQTLDAFEISPDGRKLAIGLDHELYLLPYDLQAIMGVKSRRDLAGLSPCKETMPLHNVVYKEVRWSQDSQKLAAVFFGVGSGGQRVDQVRVFDASQCSADPPRLEEFPGDFFTMDGYLNNPVLQSFGWNGETLFALNTYVRNGGFGDLYIYNSEVHKLQTTNYGSNRINPVAGACCYRDPRWSPDGNYLLFVFQDIRQGENAKIQVYYVPFGDIGSGSSFTPLTLPETLLKNRDEKLYPVLRPAK